MSEAAPQDRRRIDATGPTTNDRCWCGACGGRNGLPTDAEREAVLNTTVARPGVHMAGSNARYNAHIEVGPHGFALVLAPDVEYPVLDVNGTSEQLDVVVRGLQAALASRCASNADTDRGPAQMKPQRAAPRAESPMTS